MARLFGEVNYIADFGAISLHAATMAQIQDVLCAWALADDPVAAANELTVLVGRYIVVLEDGGSVTHIYSGSEATFPVYYGTGPAGTLVHTQWVQVLKWLGRVEIQADRLREWFKEEYVTDQATFFSGLHMFKPYAVYRLADGHPRLVTHTYPGLHTLDARKPLEYGVDEYLAALGAYKPHYDEIALAFSGGTDSRLLAYIYRDKLAQVLTITQKEPYVAYTRLRAHAVGQRLAESLNIPYTHIEVDYQDEQRLVPYTVDFAHTNPFSSFLAAHFYDLAQHVQPPAVMTGTNGDSIWHWGLTQIYFGRNASRSTSSRYIWDDLRTTFDGSLRSVASRITVRYLSRLAMMKSFRQMRFSRIINMRRTFGPQFDAVRRYPYKMFSLDRYVDYCTTGEVTSWVRAADYAGKRALLPYTSPLAMHVSSHIKRRHFFDLKAPFRHILSEFDPSTVDPDVVYPPDIMPYNAPMFTHDEVPAFNQAYVNQHCPEPVELDRLEAYRAARMSYYQTRLYHLFQHVETELARPVLAAAQVRRQA